MCSRTSVCQSTWDNLAYSNIRPRAANRFTLHPVGKIPNVAFCSNGMPTTMFTLILRFGRRCTDLLGYSVTTRYFARVLGSIVTPLPQSLLPHCVTTSAAQLLLTFCGPTEAFLKTWGVAHATSSPHYPQSNGKAEATVKAIKKLISAAWSGRSINWDKLSRALLQYRNTPCQKDGFSPAQKLFGHPVQDTLPAHRRQIFVFYSGDARVLF